MAIEMLERILQGAGMPLRKSELLSKIDGLDFKILGAMLDELETQGKVVIGGKGALWTYNESKKFNEFLNNAVVHDG